MKFRQIIYSVLCFAIVVGLMSFTPGRSTGNVDVDQQLLDRAKQQGLLEVELPAGAIDIVRNGCEVDGVLTGEITFNLNEVIWVYRCAAAETADAQIPDLSGLDGTFETQEVQIHDCAAKVSVSADGVGKIIWYDAADGMAYSLTMDTNAKAETLQSIAKLMYTSLL